MDIDPMPEPFNFRNRSAFPTCRNLSSSDMNLTRDTANMNCTSSSLVRPSRSIYVFGMRTMSAYPGFAGKAYVSCVFE